MKLNKIFFVGLGGAGQRHLRIFRELLPPETEFTGYRSLNKTPLLNPDFTVNKSDDLSEKYRIKLFDSLEEGLEDKPDLIVISTPTSLHYDVARNAAEKNISVFVEKPFSHTLDGFEDFKRSVIENKLCFFTSFQRRFHPYFIKIKEILSGGGIGEIISGVFNVGSYVPGWHPYEDFRELYACRKDLGGGVLLTEIHELDLCHWYFGMPEYISCTGGNYSQFDLDVEDTAHVSLKYKDFAIQVNLCFMQKHNRRDFFIAGTDGYIEWDTDGNRLTIINYKSGKEEALSDPDYANDAMFLSQAEYFMENVGPTDSAVNLEATRASLAMVEAAKESIQNGTQVALQ